MSQIIIDKSKTNIGWIGTGIMGAPMCGHIVDAGFNANIFNRTKTKANNLINAGANWCNSPKEVAEKSDVIFTIVGFPNDVKEVYFGDNGVFSGIKPNTVLVDMTTTEPTLAIEIYNKAKELKCFSVDAPVSGGDKGAIEAQLSIMVGGDKDIVDSLMTLLNLLGKKIVYQGRAGSGQHSKMCNQIMVSGIMISMCETLLYSYKAGLNPQAMIQSVGSGAASNWLLNNLGPKILEKDFNPGFFVEHFIKDLGIALRESQKMGIELPGLNLARSLYEKTEELGYGRLGTQALFLALEQLSKD